MSNVAPSGSFVDEVKILHRPMPTVLVNGKPVLLKRPSLRDTLDLIDDLMAVLKAANSGKVVDPAAMSQTELGATMFTNMRKLFRVPARMAGLDEDSFYELDSLEASELFKTAMQATDLATVFANLQAGWNLQGLTAPPPAPTEASPIPS